MKQHYYLCIDLKSFYASVECVERGLNPMTENLIVADMTRTNKTICLAVSPSMKALGVKNRCRVFEIPQNINYITAPPRMKLYINYAAEIYDIYLNYVSKDDIHVYSIDEAFLDVTDYLSLYNLNAIELGQKIIADIYNSLGLYAACGVGTNLYLTKVALDITAKHSKNFIGYLDEDLYQKNLWTHRPLTDFWHIGQGIAKRLASLGIYTMKDITETDEDLLYRTFGIDAELLIDHAWGREPVTIKDIKNYKPKHSCLSSGQVLMRDYAFDEGKLIVKEMIDLLCLDLVEKELVTNSITLHVGYSRALNIAPAHGTVNLDIETNADIVIMDAVCRLYERIVHCNLHIRRISITCNNVIHENYRQYSFFTDNEDLERNRKIQKTVIDIKNRFGKNAILRGMDLLDNATTIERNMQIGGHKSGE